MIGWPPRDGSRAIPCTAVSHGLTPMAKKERALTRFRCGHCRSRLVMHDRHLDRLVACPACGRTTHPVAGRLTNVEVAALAAPRKSAVKSASPGAGRAVQGCANCGQPIGKLQVRRLWHQETVCQPCYTKLAAEMTALAAAVHRPSRAGSIRPAASVVARQAADTPARVATAPVVTPVTRPDRVSREAPTDVPALKLSMAPVAPIVLVGAACAGFVFALSVMSYMGGFVWALMLVAGAAVGMRWLRRGTSSVRARFEQIAALRRRHGTSHVCAMLVAWLRSQPAGRLPYAVFLLLFWGAMYVPYRLSSFLQTSRPATPVRLSA